jgi:hypothetical protein
VGVSSVGRSLDDLESGGQKVPMRDASVPDNGTGIHALTR